MVNGKLGETLQSRRFWMTIIVIGLGTGLFISGHIEAEQLGNVVKWAAGVYVGGLSLEDAASKLQGLIKDD